MISWTSLSHKPLVPFLHLLHSVALVYNKSFLATSWLDLTPSDMGLWSHTIQVFVIVIWGNTLYEMMSGSAMSFSPSTVCVNCSS